MDREIIADNLYKAGWSLGWVSALDIKGRTVWIVDAHGYGKPFIVRADELLTAFVETTGDTPVRDEFIVVRLSPLFEIALVLVRFDHVASIRNNGQRVSCNTQL